ncbi:MAG: winged helix-turn-helix domain-containing protein [Candidatus Bathyarchaeota archaeon]
MNLEPTGISIINDPIVAKLFADDTRRRILHMLRHREMSTTDLAKALQRNHSSIQHHITLLKNAGLICLTREKKVRNMVQPYYRATAHSFIISYSLTEALTKDDGYSTWRESAMKNIYEGLETFGIKIPENMCGRVIELIGICYERERVVLQEVVERQSDPGKLDAHTQRALVRLMTNIKLSRDEEYTTAVEELNGLF